MSNSNTHFVRNFNFDYVTLGYWESLDELRGVYRSGKQWDPQSDPSERELLVRGVCLFSCHLVFFELYCVVYCSVVLLMLYYIILCDVV